ncbi:MAG: hypothetical protein ACK5SI_11100, partial [Planctomycetia bacterium]
MTPGPGSRTTPPVVRIFHGRTLAGGRPNGHRAAPKTEDRRLALNRSAWGTPPGERRDAIAAEIDVESARFWESAVVRLAREINLGWWLAGWLPWAVAVGLVGTFAMLYTRLRGGHPGIVWTGIVLVLGAAAVAAWRRCRHRFESPASARVRLEEAHGLKARLTAAKAGIGSWPDRPAPDG